MSKPKKYYIIQSVIPGLQNEAGDAIDFRSKENRIGGVAIVFTNKKYAKKYAKKYSLSKNILSLISN